MTKGNPDDGGRDVQVSGMVTLTPTPGGISVRAVTPEGGATGGGSNIFVTLTALDEPVPLLQPAAANRTARAVALVRRVGIDAEPI